MTAIMYYTVVLFAYCGRRFDRRQFSCGVWTPVDSLKAHTKARQWPDAELQLLPLRGVRDASEADHLANNCPNLEYCVYRY